MSTPRKNHDLATFRSLAIRLAGWSQVRLDNERGKRKSSHSNHRQCLGGVAPGGRRRAAVRCDTLHVVEGRGRSGVLAKSAHGSGGTTGLRCSRGGAGLKRCPQQRQERWHSQSRESEGAGGGTNPGAAGARR